MGSSLRAAVGLLLPPGVAGAFPISTFTVNVVGTLVLAALASAALRGGLAPWVLPAVGTGFCGGLTTFSTFIVDLLKLANAGKFEAAAVYGAATLLATLGAGVAGWALAASLTPEAPSSSAGGEIER